LKKVIPKKAQDDFPKKKESGNDIVLTTFVEEDVSMKNKTKHSDTFQGTFSSKVRDNNTKPPWKERWSNRPVHSLQVPANGKTQRKQKRVRSGSDPGSPSPLLIGRNKLIRPTLGQYHSMRNQSNRWKAEANLRDVPHNAPPRTETQKYSDPHTNAHSSKRFHKSSLQSLPVKSNRKRFTARSTSQKSKVNVRLRRRSDPGTPTRKKILKQPISRRMSYRTGNIRNMLDKVPPMQGSHEDSERLSKEIRLH
jgi:hypothetical protein